MDSLNRRLKLYLSELTLTRMRKLYGQLLVQLLSDLLVNLLRCSLGHSYDQNFPQFTELQSFYSYVRLRKRKVLAFNSGLRSRQRSTL